MAIRRSHMRSPDIPHPGCPGRQQLVYHKPRNGPKLLARGMFWPGAPAMLSEALNAMWNPAGTI